MPVLRAVEQASADYVNPGLGGYASRDPPDSDQVTTRKTPQSRRFGDQMSTETASQLDEAKLFKLLVAARLLLLFHCSITCNESTIALLAIGPLLLHACCRPITAQESTRLVFL